MDNTDDIDMVHGNGTMTGDKLTDLLCDLTVAANSAGADLIGAAHTLYYQFNRMGIERAAYEVRIMREKLNQLDNALTAVDRLGLFSPQARAR